MWMNTSGSSSVTPNSTMRILLLFLRIEMFNFKDYFQYKLYCFSTYKNQLS